MSSADDSASGQRRTVIGPFSGAQPGTSRTRPIPVPWIDCVECGWRHYPSATGGAWHIATVCVSCRKPLPDVTTPDTDEKPEVTHGDEATDDDGEARTRAGSP
jgi:hypothetical protein